MCTLCKHAHGTSLTYVILKFAVRVFTLNIAFASTLDKRRTTLSLYRTIELYAYNLSYIHNSTLYAYNSNYMHMSRVILKYMAVMHNF